MSWQVLELLAPSLLSSKAGQTATLDSCSYLQLPQLASRLQLRKFDEAGLCTGSVACSVPILRSSSPSSCHQLPLLPYSSPVTCQKRWTAAPGHWQLDLHDLCCVWPCRSVWLIKVHPCVYAACLNLHTMKASAYQWLAWFQSCKCAGVGLPGDLDGPANLSAGRLAMHTANMCACGCASPRPLLMLLQCSCCTGCQHGEFVFTHSTGGCAPSTPLGFCCGGGKVFHIMPIRATAIRRHGCSASAFECLWNEATLVTCAALVWVAHPVLSSGTQPEGVV